MILLSLCVRQLLSFQNMVPQNCRFRGGGTSEDEIVPGLNVPRRITLKTSTLWKNQYSWERSLISNIWLWSFSHLLYTHASNECLPSPRPYKTQNRVVKKNFVAISSAAKYVWALLWSFLILVIFNLIST